MLKRHKLKRSTPPADGPFIACCPMHGRFFAVRDTRNGRILTGRSNAEQAVRRAISLNEALKHGGPTNIKIRYERLPSEHHITEQPTIHVTTPSNPPPMAEPEPVDSIKTINTPRRFSSLRIDNKQKDAAERWSYLILPTRHF